MKRLMNMRVFVAVLVATCLIVLLMAAPTRSITPGVYDPWLDVNNDGKIDGKDIALVALIFGTAGQSIIKASINYDSGWINITDRCGRYINVSDSLNSTDIMVDIQGKTTATGFPHQMYYGLTLHMPGWSKTYGGTGIEHVSALVQTTDGGYALAGHTNSYGAGDDNFWLVKTDWAGNMLWNKTYGGAYDDDAFALVQTSDGGYALAGATSSYGAGGSDAWLVKTNSAGNMLWNKTYGGTGSDGAYALVQTTDGGYALAGYTNSYGAGGTDAWLVKTNSTGDMLWNKAYGYTGTDVTYALVQTSDGGYALAGTSNSYGAGSGYDFWLSKTDASGNYLWGRIYIGTGLDVAYALVQTTDGGYALAGYTNSYGAGMLDFWLVKTDSTGNTQWWKTYGGTGSDAAYALVQTTDGGYALAGYTGSFGAGSGYDFWLVKTDASGNMLWNKIYEGTGDDEAYALVQTSDGGYALAGVTFSSGVGSYDARLVKTDVESGLAWTGSTPNLITLYRGATDPWWNFVRVRIWQVANP